MLFYDQPLGPVLYAAQGEGHVNKHKAALCVQLKDQKETRFPLSHFACLAQTLCLSVTQSV